MERHIFGVTEVNELVKLLVDHEPMLQNVYVRGELSNYKMYIFQMDIHGTSFVAISAK